MNIPIKTGVNADCPSIPVETGDTNIPRKPILFEGGDIPAVINPLSVTENGTYTAPAGLDGYNPVEVNVPTPVLTTLNATENGTYYPEEGVTGFNEVNVEVPPVLETLNVTANGTYTPEEGVDGFNEVNVNVEAPTTEIVSNYDFSSAAYDTARSIIKTAPDVSSYIYGAPYNATVSGGEMLFNTTGQGYFHPSYYLNDFNNYEIEISFGTVDNSQGGWELGGFKIYGQNYCVWLNYENNVLTAFNSSGNFQIPNRSLADFSNKTIKFLVTHKISPTTNDTLTEVSILFEGETTPTKLGDVDNKLPYYPFIGSLSGNAIRGIAIKSMKITESKWI